MAEPDDQFFDRADAHIKLANEHVTDSIGKGKSSASFLYGASRFNAWVSACTCDSAEEMEKDKESFVNYYLEQYKKNLVENLDDYISNFNKYMNISDESA